MIKEKNWLFSELEKCSDTFVKQLLEMAKKALASPSYQPLTLGIFRSDYMIHKTNPHEQSRLYQIELNTVSCSFVGVMEKISNMHKYLLEKYQKDPSVREYYHTNQLDTEHDLPSNNTIQETAKAFLSAIDHYPSKTGSKSILFVVQERETNGVDQFLLSNYINTHSSIHCYYKTINELLTDMTVEDGVLYIYPDRENLANKCEIGLVYYRSCYNPSDLNTPELLSIREQIECSRAIKCPNVLLQLTGMKCIQQALTEQNVLEQFLSKEESNVLRECFAGIWKIHTINDENREAIQDAIEHPENYVLKPQREGGGHLIWGEDIKKILTNEVEPEEGKDGLILMTKIVAQQYPSVHVIDTKPTELPSIHEYGVFSSVLGGDEEVYQDHVFGHLFKTKDSTSMEGGVCAGFACLNTAYLIDQPINE